MMLLLWSRNLLLNLCLLYTPGLGVSNLQRTRIDTVSAFPCDWRVITFECTVNEGGLGGTTVWKGTAFSGCSYIDNEITLLHHRFNGSGETNTSVQCSTGHITLIGQSVRVENNSYISQLEVVIKPGHDDMPLKNVTCAHDDGTTVIDIDSMTINTSYTCMASEILNDSAINHTTTLEESQDLDTIIISGTLSFLFVLVLFIVPLLLCGLYKKFRSNPIHGSGDRAPGENLRIRQVINYNYDEVGGCVEIVKSFDNKSTMGIYSLTDNIIDSFAGGINAEGGDASSCNLKYSLVCALQGQVSSKWYSFGLTLGVPKEFLNHLKCDSDEECLGEVLEYWLKQHPGKPTWKEIMDAKNKIALSTAQYTCNYSVPH